MNPRTDQPHNSTATGSGEAQSGAWEYTQNSRVIQLERELAAAKADTERLDWLCDTHAGLKWQRLDLLVTRGALDAARKEDAT